MIQHRLAMLRNGMAELLKNISQDHFQGRASQTFLVNNFQYMTSKFKLLPENAFLHEELTLFEKLETDSISKYIVTALDENFAAMVSATNESQPPNQKQLESAV
jgi:hypothetical protein